MKRTTLFLLPLVYLFSACGGMPTRQTPVDLIVYGGIIYTCDPDFSITEAMVVADGQILATGPAKKLFDEYSAQDSLNLRGKACYPGFIDAHAHFYNYARQKLRVDLTGISSWEECLDRVKMFADEVAGGPILGHGWDQNDWEIQEYPTNAELNELFPNQPVALTRIGGHALLANSAALAMAGFTSETQIAGGELLQADGSLTGLCIDAAEDSLRRSLPGESLTALAETIHEAEQDLFAVGLTGVIDAGLPLKTIRFIDSLQHCGVLQLPLNIWAQAEDRELDHYLTRGIYQTGLLTVRGFKIYCDGALGSRGAYLKAPYYDRPHWHGLLVTDSARLFEVAHRIANSDFQMNTHAIGDSGNALVLSAYASVLEPGNDRRWRIEHAQVVTPGDYPMFKRYAVIPSVQPTHATSDMYWAKDRLGPERMAHAYAYKDLLSLNGWMPLGTDFPVEQIDPKWTFYAAVFRTDADGFPKGGFQPENGLSRREALLGMTLWAAKSGFWEDSRGSLEVGKRADFVVPDVDWMSAEQAEIGMSNIAFTYLAGQRVHTLGK